MNAEMNTRLERLTEATEAMMLATLAHNAHVKGSASNLDDARAEYRAALAEVIAPVFRLVEGGLEGQAQIDSEFKCYKCGATKRCELNCGHWAATIRDKIDTAAETFEICTVCDCPDDPSIACYELHCPRKENA